MTASYYMPTDDAGKADFLDPLFSFHPVLRGEKKIQTTATALFSSSSTPSRTPPTPLPPPGTSVLWKYKAIYRFHDEQVGEWSDVLSVVVGG